MNGERKPQSTVQAQKRTLEKQTAEAKGKIPVDRRQHGFLSSCGMQTTQRIFDGRSNRNPQVQTAKMPRVETIKQGR